MLKSNSSQLDQISQQWETLWKNGSNEDFLNKSLPQSLAAPAGWESEVLDGPVNDDYSQLINSANVDDYQFKESPLIDQFKTEENIQEIPIKNFENVHRKESFQQKFESSTNENYKNQPPLILHRQLPNNQVTYQQNVSVRYLQPPTPPPPGPIIIREVRPPPLRAKSPVKIRQRAPTPRTPPPIIIRERPPPAPCQEPTRIVEKIVSTPGQCRRRMIVERFAPAPPKPADIIIERWLPYKRNSNKRILYERAQEHCLPREEPNLLILHDRPRTRIEKEFINQGVVKVDPQSYIERYGPELRSRSHEHDRLVEEAIHSVPKVENFLSSDDSRLRSKFVISPSHSFYRHQDYREDERRSYSFYDCDDHRSYGSSSYPVYDSDRPRFYNRSPYPTYDFDDRRYGQSRRSTDDYHRYPRASIPTMVDVTSSWNRHCYSPDPTAKYSPRTVHVKSDREINTFIEDLTNGQRTVSFNSY